MKWRRLCKLTLLLLIGLFLAACSRSRSRSSQLMGFVPSADSAQAAEEESAAQQGADGADTAQSGGPADTRRIIANANISLVVAETDAAVARIEMIMSDLGGYLANVDLSKSTYGETEALHGSLTLRVPAASLDDALDQLQALATDVRNLNVSRQDVTDQYSDIEAQLRNLRATEQELLALLTEVRQKPDAKAEDILAVHRSLTDIRGQIETLQGRKNLLDNQIGFSTIWVELTPDSINRPIVEQPWSAAGPARNALRALVSTLKGLLTALIWALLYLTPLLLVFLIPLAVLIWLVRLWQRRRKKDGE